MKVPFVDLAPGVAKLRERYLEQIARVIDSGRFAGGPAVEGFEREFAKLCGVDHAVAVSSGTDALFLALRAAGVGPGDQVILPANSFFATAEAVSWIGAEPVFCDVREDTLSIDPERVAALLGERTRAIVPVHLFGQVVDMEPLEALASGRGVTLIEDACQAHGASRRGRTAGSLGLAAAFSFYPTKNLGALGEGGAVTTADAELAAAVRRLRDHGQAQKHVHQEVGLNARLAAIQCACLSVALEQLEESNRSRRRLAAAYRERLAEIPGVRLVDEDPDGEPVYHLFVVRVADRDRVRAELERAGIGTAVHYPTPIPLQPAYASLGHTPADFPVAERAAREMISLPMFPSLSLEQVDQVAAALRRAVEQVP